MKKIISIALAGALLLASLVGCSKPADTVTPPAPQPDVTTPVTPDVTPEPKPDVVPEAVTPLNLAVLAGPTGVGAAQLMAENAAGNTKIPYNVTVESDNQVVTALLTSGDADIAAVATNVASTLYNKKNDSIQMLAVNTLGVLYILEKGESVKNIADLAGKTIWTTGQGANPEYTLNYLLKENGLTVGEDVTVEFMTASEVSAKMIESEDGICMLPVPASTGLMMQDSAVREAVDLNEVWENVTGSSLTMGCVAVRTDYLSENPDIVTAFLEDYAASINYISDPANLDSAAQMVAEYAITPNAKIASLAIPKCGLTLLTGSAMRTQVQQYFKVLFQANPASIGGASPYDEFYYIP